MLQRHYTHLFSLLLIGISVFTHGCQHPAKLEIGEEILVNNSADSLDYGPCYSLLLEIKNKFHTDLSESKQLADNIRQCGIEHQLPIAQLIGEYWLGANASIRGDNEQALKWLHAALSRADSIGYTKKVGMIRNNLGMAYDALGQLPKAMHWYQEALNLATHSQDTFEIVRIHLNIGAAYLLQDIYDLAAQHLIKSITFAEASGLNEFLYMATINLSVLYDKQGDFDQALQTFEKGYRFCQLHKLKQQIPQLLVIKGSFLVEQGEFEKAGLLLDTLVNLPEYRESDELRVVVDKLRGRYYFNQKNLGQAMRYYLKAYERASKQQLRIYQVQCLEQIAAIRLQQKRYKEAYTWAKHGLSLQYQIDSNHHNIQLPALLAESAQKIGQSADAFLYSQLQVRLQDSIYAAEKIKATQNAQIRFETQQKEQQIALLEKDQAITDQQLYSSDQQVKLWVSITVLCLIGGLIFWWLMRRKTALAAQLTIQNEQLNNLFESKNQLLRVLSHDVRTPIGYLESVLLLLKQKQQHHEGEADELYDQALKTTRYMDEVTTKVLSSIGQESKNLSLHPTKLYLKPVIADWLTQMQVFAQQKNIELVVEGKLNKPITTDPVLLQQVFNNLVSNAIKASPQSATIRIQLQRVNNGHLQISIMDEGPGFKNHNAKAGAHGNGLYLVQYYLRLLRGTLSWKLNQRQGTTFQIRLPLL